MVKSPQASFMEKKFTSLELILSEIELDQDLDSSQIFQTSFLVLPIARL